MKRVPDRRSPSTAAGSRPPVLSRRQIRILAAAACGQTNREIAATLGIQRAAVSSTLLRADRILGTGSLAGMVRRACVCGILSGPTPETRPPVRLSRAWAAVLSGLANGSSTQQIAEGLAVSEDTVKPHPRKLFTTLGATSSSHAVALAWQYLLH